MIAKQFRIRRWRAQKILKKGKSKDIGMFIIKFLPNKKDFHRWGVVLSRKFAKLATERNRKRRQLYEAIRNNIKEHKKETKEDHYDIVIIPKKKILTCNYQKIYQNITDIIKIIET